MDAHGHRIWRYAGLAWIALVVVPIGYAAVRWQMGLGHDPDMSGVGELMLSMLAVILVPMAALAFGVLAPLAIGVDQLTNARTPRAVNVLIGAALSAPALVVAVVAVGWPEHAIRDALAALGHLGRAPGFVLAVLLAGIIVGFGLLSGPAPRVPSLRVDAAATAATTGTTQQRNSAFVDTFACALAPLTGIREPLSAFHSFRPRSHSLV